MRNSTKKKYLNYLKDIYNHLKHTESIDYREFSKRHKVSSSLLFHCEQAGMVKKIGNNRFVWQTEYPSQDTVRELSKRLLAYNEYYREKRKREKGLEEARSSSSQGLNYVPAGSSNLSDLTISPIPVTPKRQGAPHEETQNTAPQIEYYKIRLFWGLINLKIKANYL